MEKSEAKNMTGKNKFDAFLQQRKKADDSFQVAEGKMSRIFLKRGLENFLNEGLSFTSGFKSFESFLKKMAELKENCFLLLLPFR